jgi:cell division septation protein DedD
MTMSRVSQTLVLIAATLCVGLSGCSREQRDWRSAQAADSLESYDQFLQLHPDSERAAQARSRLLQLTEERDWQRASTTDTADAYKQFLNQHGGGKWSAEARIRLENFSLEGQPLNVPAASAGSAAPNAHTPSAASTTPAARAPSAVSSAPPAARSPSVVSTEPGASAAPDSASVYPAQSAVRQAIDTQTYRIQLGAFSSEAKASAEWQRLQSVFNEELGSLQPQIVSATTSAGNLFRLQSHMENESKARAVCAALAAKSQGCVVVLPQH